jgi:hypothetical protein
MDSSTEVLFVRLFYLYGLTEDNFCCDGRGFFYLSEESTCAITDPSMEIFYDQFIISNFIMAFCLRMLNKLVKIITEKCIKLNQINFLFNACLFLYDCTLPIIKLQMINLSVI